MAHFTNNMTGHRQGYNYEGYRDPTPEEAIRNIERNPNRHYALPGAKEDAEQIAIIEWAAYMVGKYPCLERLLHIPNGGSRNRIEAAKLKRMGVRPGVPDLLLPFPAGGWSGLWLEMKTEKGRPTPCQRDWIEYLRSVGYCAYVCHGAGEAINAIEAYLAIIHEGPRERVARLERELAAARAASAEAEKEQSHLNYFVEEANRMVERRNNHPGIIQ